MTAKLGIIMDPIQGINIKKDTSFAMLLEAQRRDYQVFYLEMGDLHLHNGKAYGSAKPLKVKEDPNDWFEFGQETMIELAQLDVILMRKDPPFDTEFIYATYLLEQAEAKGTLVVNKPQSLRDANEKLFTAWFPQCTPKTLVTRSSSQIREFLSQEGDIILKPLDGMGGASIFRVRKGDPNVGVIIETLTKHGSEFAMAQAFIPEIVDGDKRIIMINGEPVPYCLARIPAKGETRGNLAAGGHGEARNISDADRWIANQVGQTLRDKGLLFVGLDVIGDKLTEINVTSPTCVREIEAAFDIDIMGRLFDVIEEQRNERKP